MAYSSVKEGTPSNLNHERIRELHEIAFYIYDHPTALITLVTCFFTEH